MKIFLLLSLLFATPAFSQHSSWSQSRSGTYFLPYTFTTQSEVIHSELKFQDNTLTSVKGVGLKTAVGTELAQFVRFSAYHLYRDLSSSPSYSLRGPELGGELGITFSGPVVNIQFALGLHATRQVLQSPQVSTVYFGQGYTGTLGFERFISSKVSVLLSVKGQNEELNPEFKSNETLTTNSAGASFALVLWLQ
jgi:hypothetical protein